jgi:hypothetical protein
MWSWPASSLPRCTRLFDSMSFRLNRQVLYEETDLLLRYGRCSFGLLHGHGYVEHPARISRRLKTPEVFDESIDLSRDR